MSSTRDPIVMWKGEWRGDARLFLQATYTDRLKCKALGSSFWDGKAKAWHIPFSPALVASVEHAFPLSEGYTYEMSQEVEELWSKARLHTLALDAKSGVELSPLPASVGGWLHQRRAFHFAKEIDASGIFLDMGGGKSLVAIACMDEWDCQLVLVLCPKSVMGVWPKEFKKWSLRNWLVWSPAGSGTVEIKAGVLAHWLATTQSLRRPRAVVLNYDACWRPRMGAVLTGTKWDTEVLDESHKIKAPGGVASKFVGGMRKHSRRVLLLTGTPQPHGPEDVYAQFRAADPGVFGTSFARFRAKYFETKKINDKVEVIVDFKNDEMRDEFTRKMGSISIVIPRADMVGDKTAGEGGGIDPSRVWALPAVERQVYLTTKTFKVYQDLKKELVAEVEQGIVTADNALVKLMRLRQIVSGHVRLVTGEVVAVGVEKEAGLEEVLGDVPEEEPVVVFGVFHHDLDAVERVSVALGRSYLELSGRRRDGLTAEGTMAGRGGEVLGAQLQSGGVGIDLTRSCYVVNYSLDYNLGNIQQAAMRYDRPGQWRAVTVVNLVAVNPAGGATVDGLTYEALEKRQALNQVVLDALRNT